jgi:GT2 family glycosyltransferase
VVLEGPTFREETPKSLLWEAPHNPSGGARISCNFAISRETFFQCGGFDERYTVSAFEDIEFFSRAERLDVETRFVAEAGVDHPLRRIANAQKLAARWESKIIYALDQGASAVELVWRFPEHVAKVIIVRFRKCALNWENLRAVVLFTFEFLWMLWWLPKWLIKRKAEARSAFWAGQVRSGRAVPRYGL